MSIKGADVIAEFLEARGVRHAFGIIGAGNAAIFDAIARRGFTEIVCVHHEQAACMAMQTYARITGRPGVALLTTGGGSTNGVTGVVSAWMDSLPCLVISGNENSRFTRADNPLRIWGVQGYESAGMVAGVTKYAARPTSADRVVFELEKAWAIAGAGRPGPCWIDVPMDYQAAPISPETIPHFPLEVAASHSGVVERAAAETLALLSAAERPVLWLGNGVRLAGAADQVRALVEALGAPTLVSWAGIDLIASDHPLVYGRAGVYGQRASNLVLQNADLVIAIGARLAMPQVGYALDEFARAAKLVVVDIDPDEVAKHGDRVNLPVQADAGAFVARLLDRAEAPAAYARPDWIARCDDYRVRYPRIGPEHADKPGFINSYSFMERLNGHLKPDQVIVTDMGTALLSGHQVLMLSEGQRMMTSTGLGEMGYGLPGAIGASFARDRGEVMCLNCDGGMMMNLQELQTVAHHRLPIKLFIFNNDGYLMIKHTQTNLYQGRRVGVDDRSGVSCPDFSKLAAVFGFSAYQVHTWEDFDRVIPMVQAHDGPVVCEVFMDPEQLFLPKLSLAAQADGTIVSPPLEDLSPLLPREEMARNMIVGLHPKSAAL